MSSSYIAPLRILRHTGSGDPEVKLALAHLSAELKNRLTKPYSPQSLDLFLGAVRALSEIKGSAHAETRMACLVDCISFFYVNDVHSAALASVRILDALARQTQLKPWVRKANSLAGVVHADLGNVAEALMRLSTALGIARELGDAGIEIATLNNLSTALIYGGLYKDAARCCEKAAGMARLNRDNPLVIRAALEVTCLTNMAQSFYYVNDFEAGFAAISHCLSISLEPATPIAATNRSILEYTYVLLALELGQVESAYTHSIACQKYGAHGGARALVLAEISVGLCAVYRGQVDEGMSILEKSLERSRHAGALRTDAVLALVKALDQIGQPRRALSYIREVLEQIKVSRQEAVSTLLSSGDRFETPNSTPFVASNDLAALQLTEANLRARAAEQEVMSTRLETLERLAITADLKEEASGEHGYRVGRLSFLLAKDLGWTADACHALELAARLHDIGKIGMPDSILLKSSALLASERHFLDAHVSVGAELLSKSGMPHLRLAEEVARFHHEWWDGSGYPARLNASRIPLHARIVALADVFDALTHGRPYADPWPAQRALAEIRSRRGTQFDPDLTDRFLGIIEHLRSQYSEVDAGIGGNAHASTFFLARTKIRRLLEKESENVRRETGVCATHA